MVLSWYILPIHLNGLACIVNLHFFGIQLISELSNVWRDKQKDKINHSAGVFQQWFIYFIVMFVLLPKTVFRKTHLAASGYSKHEAPLLHYVLFEYNTIIMLVLSGILLIWFCFTLKRGALRYQFSRLANSVMISILVGVAVTQGMMQYFLGVFWSLFIGIVVSANDCFAYIVGRSIGKTPLIRLSPNKTLEGFIGGSVCCFIWVYA
jgi:phosphatidate cytidylyltransferase